MESPDSASPAITRAVASALQGRAYQGRPLAAWQKLALIGLASLPDGMARRLVVQKLVRQALPPEEAEGITADRLAAMRLGDYARLSGRFECIVLGAALGGAAAHVAAALGAPFLPQPFVLSFRGGAPEGDLHARLGGDRQLVRAILAGNENLLAISHFDPIHDDWLTGRISHVRLKLLDLPQAYADFIQARLRPGGTIVYLDCTTQWPAYVLDHRHRLQIGGHGDINPSEYLQGSDRLDQFLARTGSPHRGGWPLADHEHAWFPESEWGTEPGLDEALQDLALRRGYDFSRIRLPGPHDFSVLAYQAQQRLLARNGLRPQGVLVEMFGQYDPVTALRGALLPVWLVFHTRDSLEFLRRMRAHFPRSLRVYMCLLATFSRPPDMVQWSDWQAALPDFEVVHVGARRGRYPQDLTALGRWPDWLDRAVPDGPGPIRSRLSPEDITDLASALSSFSAHR